MSRVITFSRTFPGDHPRGGEPTYFVEKFHWWFWDTLHFGDWASCIDMLEDLNPTIDAALLKKFIDSLYINGNFNGISKGHTVRAGNRFKAGDKFSPRVWSGKPYNSKQIILAPDTEIVKTWDVEIDECDIWAIGLPGTQIKYLDEDQQAAIAKNDGLSEEDLYFWFKTAKKPFIGQVICWNPKVEY